MFCMLAPPAVLPSLTSSCRVRGRGRGRGRGWGGMGRGRGEATNPVHSECEHSGGLIHLGSPGFRGILAPWGRHVGSGCQNWQNGPSGVADQGWPSWQSRQAQPCLTGLDICFGPVHRCLACCHADCLLFPKAMVARRRKKQQERQDSGSKARTVSCITPARPERQIPHSRAIGP